MITMKDWRAALCIERIYLEKGDPFQFMEEKLL